MRIHVHLMGAASLSLALATAPAAAMQCLSFEETLELAASRDPGVEAARAERREAAASLKEARSLSRPQLSGFGRTGLGDVGAVNSVVQNQFGLRASQRVYDFGNARLAREVARNREQAGAEAIRQEQLYAAQTAGEAYLDLLQADAQLLATNDRRQYFQDLLQSVEALLSRGGATRSERADIAARLADAEAAAQELRFLRERARTQIEIDTGVTASLCAAPNVGIYLNTHMETVQDTDFAVELALANSPILKSLEKRADSFDAARRREKRARLPVIEIVGVAAYTSNGSNDIYEFQDRVGIDVSIPLYSGSSLSAQYDRAEARDALAGAELTRARRQLHEDVRITYQRVLSLQAQLISRQAVEDHKGEELAAANAEYERGVRTLRDLIDTRLDYEDAMLERIRAEYELKRRRLSLLTLTAQLPLNVEPTSAPVP